MKSKDNLKTIDPSVLDKVLGGIQLADRHDKKAVIPQPSFSSFFHS